jgi:hypothetical protein
MVWVKAFGKVHKPQLIIFVYITASGQSLLSDLSYNVLLFRATTYQQSI